MNSQASLLQIVLPPRVGGALLFITAMFLMGCPKKTVNSNQYTIDLKVRAVVGSGEVLGGSANIGCRLTEAEIVSIVQQAQRNISVFGTNTKLVWNGVVEVIVDPRSSSHGRNASLNDFVFNLLTYPNTYAMDQSKVNVFFCGNFATGFSEQVGFAIHPTGAAGSPSAEIVFPGWIVINDMGFATPSASNAAALKTRLALEHELGHYLSDGLWTTRNFGTGTSTRNYDAGGHIVVAGAPYLMIDGRLVLNQQRVLSVPGQQVQADGTGGQDELGIVSRRIFLGQWNDSRR